MSGRRLFRIIDKQTGLDPDLAKIARKEPWAQGLSYCDMEGFAIAEDGSLWLLDECGNHVSCPPERFELRWEDVEDDPFSTPVRIPSDQGTPISFRRRVDKGGLRPNKSLQLPENIDLNEGYSDE
jgi:hypothetical protein